MRVSMLLAAVGLVSASAAFANPAVSTKPANAAAAKPIAEQVCAACHGPDGKGNQAIGAPNLTDNVWLYGSTEKVIMEGITNGRKNQMPAWNEFLGEGKIHLLTAYVWGLSNGAAK